MTREEFKHLAMEIIAQQTTHFLDKDWKLFDSDNISEYGVVEYEYDGYNVANGMPFEEFLDELYEVIKDDNS